MVPCDEVFRFRFRLPVERVGHVLCLYTNGLPYAAACRGDSGGPLVVCEGDRIVVVGVAQGGVDGENPNSEETFICKSKGTVSYYADVQHYLPWIRSKLGKYPAFALSLSLLLSLEFMDWHLQWGNGF